MARGEHLARHQHGAEGSACRHGKGARDAEHARHGENGDEARPRGGRQASERARAHELQADTRHDDLASVVAVRRLAREQDEREHRQELHEPDHADEERTLLDRVIEARNRVDLPAERDAVGQHGDGGKKAAEQQKGEVGVAPEQRRQRDGLVHLGRSSLRSSARDVATRWSQRSSICVFASPDKSRGLRGPATPLPSRDRNPNARAPLMSSHRRAARGHRFRAVDHRCGSATMGSNPARLACGRTQPKVESTMFFVIAID